MAEGITVNYVSHFHSVGSSRSILQIFFFFFSPLNLLKLVSLTHVRMFTIEPPTLDGGQSLCH